MAGPVPPLAIPTTLQASLLARLDRLAPAREVAQIAAALGRQFSHELISAVAPMPQQQLDDALAQLVARRTDVPAGHPAGRRVHLQACAGAGCRLQHLAAQPTPAAPRAHRRRRSKSQFPEIVAAQPQLLRSIAPRPASTRRRLVTGSRRVGKPLRVRP